MNVTERCVAALNRLAKWRKIIASERLGTLPKESPQYRSEASSAEGWLLSRVELSALANVLISKGVITLEELEEMMIVEAGLLEEKMEQRFPGFKAADDGMIGTMPDAAKTMATFPY